MRELTEERENAIYLSQEKYIKEHISERAARNANYGWGVDDVERSITTKVYGPPGLAGALTSSMTNDGTIVHDFEEF